MEYSGKWYCWQHDPERTEADKKKHRAAQNAKADRRSAMWKRHARNARLAELVTPELAELLDGLVALAESTDIQVPALLRGPLHRTIDNAHVLAAKIRKALDER